MQPTLKLLSVALKRAVNGDTYDLENRLQELRGQGLSLVNIFYSSKKGVLQPLRRRQTKSKVRANLVDIARLRQTKVFPRKSQKSGTDS